MNRPIVTLSRCVLGGYLIVHGSQKLFGWFGGRGLDAAGQGFEAMGLTPGRQMATLAGAGELAGGVMTVTGIADPLGPIALASSMAVATAVHRKAGPMAAKGGFELPLTNLAFAALVAATGSSGHRVGPRLHPKLTAVVLAGASVVSALALSKVLTAPPPPAPGRGAAAPKE
jgi:putative oxidoreductase